MDPFSLTGRNSYSCTFAEFSNGAQVLRCENSELPPITVWGEPPYDPFPAEDTPECALYGTCEVETDPCFDNPSVCGGYGGATEPGSEPDVAAPEGVNQALYSGLNRAEKFLCWDSWYWCGDAIILAHQASVWARDQTPLLGNQEGNNKRDAIRHAYWQAALARTFGSSYAQAWGDAHEYDPTGLASAADHAMDYFNNIKGRAIGSGTGDIATEVMNAANSNPPQLRLCETCQP